MKFKDLIRFIFVSPEVLSGLAILLIGVLFPWVIQLFVKLMLRLDFQGVLAIFGVPLVLLVTAYKLGFDLLNPKENKKDLKSWPNYWMLKNRVIFSLVLGTMSLLATIIGYALIKHDDSLEGAYFLLISWAVEAAAVASVAYARLVLNDLLN